MATRRAGPRLVATYGVWHHPGRSPHKASASFAFIRHKSRMTSASDAGGPDEATAPPQQTRAHVSVMLEEVMQGLGVSSAASTRKTPISHLAPQSNENRNRVFVDGTFGRGGHTRALLERDRACRVIAIDCDKAAFEGEEQRRLIAEHQDRLIPVQGRFGDLANLVAQANVSEKKQVDGILLDLGVSSPQLDTADRGFSFRYDLNGPLDMRMDQSPNSLTAAYVVNNVAEEEIARIIWMYGEERQSRQIAKAICRYRRERRIDTTTQLADIVRRCLDAPPSSGGGRRSGGSKRGDKSIDPATRTFQALRIFVNDEVTLSPACVPRIPCTIPRATLTRHDTTRRHDTSNDTTHTT